MERKSSVRKWKHKVGRESVSGCRGKVERGSVKREWSEKVEEIKRESVPKK